MWEAGFTHAKILRDEGMELNTVMRSYVYGDGFHVGEWLYTQKARYNEAPSYQRYPLPADKAQRLEALGFRW